MLIIPAPAPVSGSHARLATLLGRLTRALLLASSWLVTAPIMAHDLHHATGQANATVVSLTYPDGSPFAYEEFEIFPTNGEIPFQVGRTDAQGRLSFLPPSPGRYEVRALSQDGHGALISVEIGPGAALIAAERPLFERYQRLFVGLGILLGLFGLLKLFYRNRPA